MPTKDKEKRAAYQREHYRKKSQYYKDKAKLNKDNLKAEINKIKSSLKCEKCPENHIACLDFHHIDPKQKDFNIADAVTRGWKLEKIIKEIEKCVVLCANCHRKVHSNL